MKLIPVDSMLLQKSQASYPNGIPTFPEYALVAISAKFIAYLNQALAVGEPFPASMNVCLSLRTFQGL